MLGRMMSDVDMARLWLAAYFSSSGNPATDRHSRKMLWESKRAESNPVIALLQQAIMRART